MIYCNVFGPWLAGITFFVLAMPIGGRLEGSNAWCHPVGG